MPTTRRPWTAPFRTVLRRATRTLPRIAAEMEVATVTLEAYLNRQEPSHQMAARLHRWVTAHAHALLAEAERLRRAATPRRTR